ncbi:extensin-like [Ostrinia furnacalis]|uniref:extensin-like n=1 Tax=Ostrinia furnacalis TaxID=93504 RepID=UPI001039443A|nr:extensin-like [Ostrinia furnacalis]
MHRLQLTSAEYYEYSKSVKRYYKNYPEMTSSASTTTNIYSTSPPPNPPMAYASPAPSQNAPNPVVVKGAYATQNPYGSQPVVYPPKSEFAPPSHSYPAPPNAGYLPPPNAYVAPPNAYVAPPSNAFAPPVTPPNALAFPPPVPVPPPIPPRTPASQSNSRYNRNMKIPPPFV